MSIAQETSLQPSAALLRRRLQEHLADFQNPILAALQGAGLSVLEVATTWIELEEQAQDAYEQTFLQTNSIQEALAAEHEARVAIAERLVAAKEGGYL